VACLLAGSVVRFARLDAHIHPSLTHTHTHTHTHMQSVGPIQRTILQLIQQWNATLCVSSRYKSDFKHINDMYRLLSYKGYGFPPMTADSIAVLTTPITLQTEQELQEQDKQAQGVKLEELLRMGTPAALAQANDLMKIMSGYDTKRIPNYRREVDEEMRRFRDKVVQLNALLSGKSIHDRWEHDPSLEVGGPDVALLG
jgi:ADP-ribosylation factor-binding protein GGA